MRYEVSRSDRARALRHGLYRLVGLGASGATPGHLRCTGTCLPGRLLDIAGCETYVVDAPALAPGPLPPVVLLHGYGDTADCWRRVVPAIQRDRRVIAIDTPPFGRSGMPPADYQEDLIGCYEQFFPALFEELGIGSAALVGHSMGGAMALTFALEDPSRVERLVLIAPAGLGDQAPWWWHAIAGRWINWPALLRLPNPVARPAVKAALRGFLEDRLVHDTRAMGEVIDHFVHLHGGPHELRHLIDTGRALMAGYTGTLLARSAELEAPGADAVGARGQAGAGRARGGVRPNGRPRARRGARELRALPAAGAAWAGHGRDPRVPRRKA